jgi:hypothetical protein
VSMVSPRSSAGSETSWHRRSGTVGGSASTEVRAASAARRRRRAFSTARELRSQGVIPLPTRDTSLYRVLAKTRGEAAHACPRGMWLAGPEPRVSGTVDAGPAGRGRR